jgi:hypothetical protein
MSSTLVFQRPKSGAVRDVRELEYVSALHQSETELVNPNGWICAGCVTALVRSRHGIVIPIEHVHKQILPDLAGVPPPKITITNSEPKNKNEGDNQEFDIDIDPGHGITADNVDNVVFLDIANVVSMLLIPKLKRHSEALEYSKTSGSSPIESEEAERFFRCVLGVFRRDLGIDNDDDDDEAPLLTRELLQTMLETYGEDPNDETAVDEMMEYLVSKNGESSDNPPRLDVPTLIKAVTSDLDAYNTRWETSKTTHSDDFLQLLDGGIGSLLKGVDCQKCVLTHGRTVEIPTTNDSPENESNGNRKPVLLKRLPDQQTLSVVDLAADTFSSEFYFVLLFLSLILIYLSFDNSVSSYLDLNGYFRCRSPDNSNYFGCEVAEAIVNWLIVVIRLGGVGTCYMLFTSAGNCSMKACGIPKNLFASLILVCITILPFFFWFSDVGENASYLEYFPHAVFAVGLLLLSYQLFSIAKLCVPKLDKWSRTNTKIAQKELLSKQAQRNKVDKIVTHALELHGMHDSNGNSNSNSNGNENGGGDGEGSIARDDTAKSTRSQSRKSTVGATASAEALRNYQRGMNEVETIGGWWYGFKRAVGGRWDADNPDGEEGIWLGARLLASFCGQWIAALLFLSLFVFSIRWVTNLYRDDPAANGGAALSINLDYGRQRAVYFNASGGFLISNRDLEAQPADYLATHNLEFAYGFDEVADADMYKVSAKEDFLRSVLTAVSAAQKAATVLGIEDAEALVDNLVESVYNSTGIDLELLFAYAQRYASYDGTLVEFVYDEAKRRVTLDEVLCGLIFGGLVGMLAILANTLVFIPSYVCQVLKYRCGVLARNPLNDARFKKQKTMQWDASSLFGVVFWSTLVSGVLVAGVLGSILFLFVWSETSMYFLAVLASAIGILTTWTLKVLVLRFFKNRTYSGFYRKNVGLANTVTIFIEVRTESKKTNRFGFLLLTQLSSHP